MRSTKFLTILAALVAFALFAGGIARAADEAGPTPQSRRGNPSPSAAASFINTYLFQDEQINIDGGEDSTVKVLRVNEKNLVNDFVVAVYPINNATPREIRGLFRLITGKEGGRAEVIRDKVGGRNYLHVIAPKFQLPYIEAALQALDEPWLKEDLDGGRQIYYKAKYRDITNIDNVASIPGGGEGVDQLIDRTANALFQRGEPYRMGKWLDTAELIDVFPPQIVLDAAVYEVDVTDDLKLGLDFVAWKCGPGRLLFEFLLWGFNSKQRADNHTGSFDPFREFFDISGEETLRSSGDNYYAHAAWLVTSEYFDFLQRKGRARLVTTGRINVRHGEVGLMSAADDLLHFERFPDESLLFRADDWQITHKVGISELIFGDIDSLQDDSCHDSREFLEGVLQRCLEHPRKESALGFTLSFIPFIGLETTEIFYILEQSDLAGLTPAGTPIIKENVMSGTVLVRDGVDICIGGLTRTEEVKSTQKIPFLGGIPYFGWLFGQEQNADRLIELVVVLSPRIIQHSNVHTELAREEDKQVRRQVKEQARLPMIETEFGFDQWILDEEKKS